MQFCFHHQGSLRHFTGRSSISGGPEARARAFREGAGWRSPSARRYDIYFAK